MENNDFILDKREKVEIRKSLSANLNKKFDQYVYAMI